MNPTIEDCLKGFGSSGAKEHQFTHSELSASWLDNAADVVKGVKTGKLRGDFVEETWRAIVEGPVTDEDAREVAVTLCAVDASVFADVKIRRIALFVAAVRKAIGLEALADLLGENPSYTCTPDIKSKADGNEADAEKEGTPHRRTFEVRIRTPARQVTPARAEPVPQGDAGDEGDDSDGSEGEEDDDAPGRPMDIATTALDHRIWPTLDRQDRGDLLRELQKMVPSRPSDSRDCGTAILGSSG